MVNGELISLRITLESTDGGILGYVYMREISPGKIKETVEVEPSIMADYDSDGQLLGVEFLDAGAIDADLMHRLAKQLDAPELAGIDLSEMCKASAA